MTDEKNFTNLIDRVVDWAEARNIFSPTDGSDAKSQMLKCVAEIGELADAINKGDHDDIKDGIGDVLVTLILTSEFSDLTLLECLAAAYDEIKDRKGKMVNGVFVKEAA